MGTKDVLDDDGGWLEERGARRGTVQTKTKYDHAGYLPHAKWKKKNINLNNGLNFNKKLMMRQPVLKQNVNVFNGNKMK